MAWCVYIVRCKNKSLYTGITNNLERRLKQHLEGRGGYYTRSFGMEGLTYTEQCSTKSKALQRECQIKRWSRSKKLALIDGDMQLLKKL